MQPSAFYYAQKKGKRIDAKRHCVLNGPHPNAAGQGYWQHMGFALSVAGRAFVIALLAALHAVFPFLVPAAAGDRILTLADEIRAARAKH